MSQPTQLSPSEHRRAVIFARFVYAFILFSFIGVCAFAVIFTMNEEKSRSGFKAIKVTAPISFMDRTYMDEGKETPSQETP